MKPKIAIVAVFVLAALAIVMFARRGGNKDKPEPVGSTKSEPAAPKDQTEIRVVYSTEKKDWIEASVAEFTKANPDIKVTLVGKGSIDAAQTILDLNWPALGGQPTIWSPADTMVMNLLASDWQTTRTSSRRRATTRRSRCC
jgi:ABC-type glycerol-3-phosphate transport system substrate-binding protein